MHHNSFISKFKIVEKFLGAHTIGHSVFTVRKIFNKVFATLFVDILYLTPTNR